MAKALQQLDDNEILHKATAAIHIDSRFSFTERKLFNVLLWNAQDNRYQKGVEYVINTEFLLKLIKWDRSKNITRLQEIIEKFTTTAITWNEGKKDKSVEWGICTFLQGGRIRGSKTYYRINDYIGDKLLTPNVFAKIMLQVQTQFSSRYSLVIYEFLMDELSRKKLNHFEQEYSLESINKLLDYEGLYKHLNNDVLKRSKKEIAKYTEIDFDYEGIKKGRKVIGLRLTVTRKNSFQCELPFNSEEELVLDEKQQGFMELLIEKGVSKRKALKLVQSFDGDRIQGNIAQVTQLADQQKVKNLPAYLVKAIEEDYRPQVIPAPKPQTVKPVGQGRAAQTKAATNAWEKQWQAFRQQQLIEKFQQMPKKYQIEKIKAFEQSIKHNDLIWAKYQKAGLDSSFVSKTFYQTLEADLLTQDIELNLDAYLQYRKDKESDVIDIATNLQ